MAPHPEDDERPVEELAAEAVSNSDETTRREALELELEEQGRSEEGTSVGDQMD